MSPTVSVRILSETHTHEDKPVAKGAVLSGIDDATAKHLVELGVAQIVPNSATTTLKGGDD